MIRWFPKLFFAFLVSALCCQAQQLPVQTTSQNPKYSLFCNIISSKPATSASRVTFQIAIPGRQVSNLSIAASHGPRRIMVLQDISGSMGEGNAHALSMRIVKDFAEASLPGDQLGLVDFSDQAFFDIRPESPVEFGKQLQEKKLKKNVRALGPTSLFDAMIAAADYLHKNSQPGDSLFVISDGLDNASTDNQEQLSADLANDRVRAYLLLFEARLTEKEKAQLQRTIQIVFSSGGNVVPLPTLNSALTGAFGSLPHYVIDEKDIRAKVEGLQRLIHNGYEIAFNLDQPITSPTDVRVLVTGNNGLSGDQMHCPARITP